MAYRGRYFDIDDSDDTAVEIEPPIDPTNDDDDARGPVDPYQTTQNRSIPAVNAARARARARARAQPLVERRDKEVRLCRLEDDTIVRPGDFVELQCPSNREVDAESSGDFLRIVKILRDQLTADVTLRGHRYVREKYLLSKDSDGKGLKMNEVVLRLMVQEGDNRPAEVQGLEDVPVANVAHKQAVRLTHKSYPFQTFRYESQSFFLPLRGMSKAEQRLYIFKNGPLVCRQSRTLIVSPNGIVYAGISRHLSEKETTASQDLQQSGARIDRLSQNNVPTTPRKSRLPKDEAYTFFDAYCGAGGASRGADSAGLKIIGGVDCDVSAMEAWELNFPGGIPFRITVAEFLESGLWRLVGRIDILNISFPCQVFSTAHTVHGKNDESNIEQLNYIKPLIEKLRPRVVILENTSGLANIEDNCPFFDKVLNDVFSAGQGYNLRYNIVNGADYGLPQERKRLIIIAARKDHPLPPFPKPTHGPAGSGLQPYNKIGDALTILEHLGDRADRDSYHKLHKQTSTEERLYDPFAKFVDCIMTKGTKTPHWSGENFTPRELAFLQSLPYHHHLTGSWPQAIKQVGNMFPPVITEMIYRLCAQTLEAFDNGLIDADDDIDDLNVTLFEKGVDIPETPATPTSLVDLTAPPHQFTYKYLSKPILSDANTPLFSSAFARR